MAVHLKKRACEEFSQVTVEKAPALKRLKLVKLTQKSKDERGEWENKVLDISNCEPQTILEALHKLYKKFPLKNEEISQIVIALITLYRKQTDVVVKSKISQVLCKVCQSIGYNPLYAIKEMIQLLENETSNQVSCQLWKAMLSSAKAIPNEDDVITKLTLLARKQLINNENAHVRHQCLLFIANLAKNNMLNTTSSAIAPALCNEQTLIGKFFKDPQPRVRSGALEAMIVLHERGKTLERSVYDDACTALCDDYETVRLMALKLVWIISQIYPEGEVRISNCLEQVRLADDAFANICNMVNDSSVKVRATAMQLLGSMHNISPAFLYQTLDKKIMSDLKRKKSLNEKAKERYVEEFASGSKWSADGPKEVDLDAAQLMSSGSCGAFVHGLEDEMMEVRTAAVDSLTELACECKEIKFPQSALDSLVDCLNDEIESVRLNAVHSLHKIMDNVTLLEDQLENVLSAMEDASMDIRYGIHKLLSKCTLMSKFCLHNTNLNLQKNLLKYPSDKMSIWEAYKYIGKHHSQLVYLLVPTLLSCHPYFDTPEPKMDDPGYIGQLILVFNAAEKCPKMTQIFPDYVMRHYQYLRDSLPDLVPQNIKLTSYANHNSASFMSPPRNTDQKSDPKMFLNNALLRNKNLQMHEPSIQRTLLQCTISDLQHVASIAPSLSSMAMCSAKFFMAQLLLSQVTDSQDSGLMLGHSRNFAYGKPIAVKIKELTQEIENLFLGLEVSEIAVLKQIRLKAIAVDYLSDFQNQEKVAQKSKHGNPCHAFFKVIQATQDYLNLHNITPDNFSKTLFNEVLKLDPNKKQSLIAKLLQPLLNHYQMSVIPLSNNVREVKGQLSLPKMHNDKTIMFKAGLATTIDITGSVQNVQSPVHNIIVKIEYPDGNDQIVCLTPADVKKVSPCEHAITKQLVISHVQWSDVCRIKITLCKLRQLPDSLKGNLYDGNLYLPICTPSEVAIQPKGLH